MKRYESRVEITGEQFRREEIGEVNTKDSKYAAALAKATAKEAAEGQEDRRIRINTAVELIKEFQPYDPTNPDKPFARDIRIEIQELLQLKEEDYDRVKSYTSAGSDHNLTPLQRWHGGANFVLIFPDKEEKDFRVTFKLTVDPKQGLIDDKNIVVLEREFPDPKSDEDDKKYLAKIKYFAEMAVAKMLVAQEKELVLR